MPNISEVLTNMKYTAFISERLVLSFTSKNSEQQEGHLLPSILKGFLYRWGGGWMGPRDTVKGPCILYLGLWRQAPVQAGRSRSLHRAGRCFSHTTLLQVASGRAGRLLHNITRDANCHV